MAAAKPPTREQRRYWLLVQQLLEEETRERGEWGAQERVAGRLDIKQPSVWRYQHHMRKPESAAIEKALKRLRLRHDFFSGQFAKEPYYKNFQGLRRPAPSESPPAFGEYEASPEGQDMAEEERDFLRDMQWPREPTPLTYHYLLMALRSLQKEDEDRESHGKNNDSDPPSGARRRRAQR